MTKTPRPSTLDNKARELVKLLYDKCATCNSREDLQWAHVFGGYYNSVRWNPFNYARQCPRCNALHNDNPRPYLRWFEQEYGQEYLDRLEKLHSRTDKYYADDYKKVYTGLTNCIASAEMKMVANDRIKLFEREFGKLPEIVRFTKKQLDRIRDDELSVL